MPLSHSFSHTSMLLRKTFSKRLLDGSKTTSSPATSKHTAICFPRLQVMVPPNASKTNFRREYHTWPEAADSGFFRRFLNRKAVYHSGHTRIPEFLSLPIGYKLKEKLEGIDISGDRVGIDGLSPSATDPATTDALYGISVNDVRKILRVSQVEKLKAKLRDIPKTSISYTDYVRICVEGCESEHEGAEFAKKLNESGNVIVLGNVVFLQPEQLAKTMESLICESIANPTDPRRKELEEMEKQKEKIDDKAKAQVRGELYCGLGLLMVQTIGFMRLTFWELSWDVMEPICFFVTSLHLALAYLFFLTTSTEPTFQGYFCRRFQVKQKKLMHSYKFDIQKYCELCKACYPNDHAYRNI